jgi:hypothetical protein
MTPSGIEIRIVLDWKPIVGAPTAKNNVTPRNATTFRECAELASQTGQHGSRHF